MNHPALYRSALHHPGRIPCGGKGKPGRVQPTLSSTARVYSTTLGVPIVLVVGLVV
ncbi:hypothetical protein [Amycolatopsis sp. MJM2582]|uniref:hypothetical protein n=1 Tax=Amycolatopsis sp. MJM2582 TaxID=1427749 RepID=UPI000A96227B|nr:hypothetical protein [Amycolatopsis sp. MJM2582]